MKKLGILMIVFALFAGVSMVSAATDDETIDVNLEIATTISLACDDSVTMGIITGTGASALATNQAHCNVITNNSAGYRLDWQASSTAYMENANGDQIAAYTPETPDVPEAWSIAGTDSEWGARLTSGSTDTDAEWGTDDTVYGAGNYFLNVSTTPREIVRRTTETDAAGSDEYIEFGAEVGATKWQPTGVYDIDVIMTATTL